jgi:hypothetical protein
MKKSFLYLLLPALLAVGIFNTCFASSGYLTQYNSATGTKGSCSVCHTSAPALNATGNTFKASGHNIASIVPSGAPAAKQPAAGATPAPGTTVPSPPAGSAVGKTSPAAPQNPSALPNPPGAKGMKKAKKNGPGGTTNSTSAAGPSRASIRPQARQAAAMPAQKNSAVRGARKAGAPQGAGGARRRSGKGGGGDSAGVAALSGTGTTTAGRASQVAPDMSIWTGRWFKIKMTNKGYYTEGAGLSADHETVVRYLNISSWNPEAKALQGHLYEVGPSSQQASEEPISLNYISGGNLDFHFWSQTPGESAYGFTGRIRGQEAMGTLKSASIASSGGYHLQPGSSGSGEHWAGWLKVRGNLVPDSVIPIPGNLLPQ